MEIVSYERSYCGGEKMLRIRLAMFILRSVVGTPYEKREYKHIFNALHHLELALRAAEWEHSE